MFEQLSQWLPFTIPADLLQSLPTLIFVGVVMVSFGYAAGNARQLNGWKVAVLLFVVYAFWNQFDRGQASLLVMMLAFLLGYFLPHATALSGFGQAISDAINAVRYRSVYADLKRREEEVERMREEYQRKLHEQNRQQAEAERARRRQQTRGTGQTGDDDCRSDWQGSASGGSRRSGSSGPQGRRSNGSGQGSGPYESNRKGSGRAGSKQSRTNYKHTEHKKRSHQNNQQSQQQGAKPPPPQNTTVRDAFLAELGLSPGEYTKAEIKLAFRRMVKQCHPDRHQGEPQAVIDQLTDQFRRVKAAHEWLYMRAPN